MKLKIKVKEITLGCMPSIQDKGDWIDLRAAEDANLLASEVGAAKKLVDGDKGKTHKPVEIPVYYIPLGVAMELPKGFEAILDVRSSTPSKYQIFIPNGQGVIDNTYNGDGDEWTLICSPLRNTSIDKFDRVCQFRIQLSQKATVWQKLRWLFSSGIELVKVDSLGNKNRGGIGSTGIK